MRGDALRAASVAGGFGAADAGRLPSVLVAIAGTAGRAADGDPPRPAHAVMRTVAGRWLELHGMRLEAGVGTRGGAVVGPARPPRLAEVVMSAYGLTARERQVSRLVISGASTAEASTALHISPDTIQDHLKAIFEKVGVRSRGELTSTVFERHHRPSR